MPIEYRAGTQAEHFTGGLSLTVPSAVQAGDLLLINWHVSLDSTPIDLPSGWAYVPDSAPGTHTIGNSRVACIYRVADATDADSAVSLAVTAGGEVKQTAALTAWSGVDQSSPIHQVAYDSSNTVTTTAHPAPQVTTTLDGCEIVITANFKDSSVSIITPPTGYTDRGSITMVGGGRSSSAQASKPAATGGTYGGEDWTTDAIPSSRGLWTIALAPSVTTQTIRPVDDVTATNVEDQGGGTVDLYAAIDESVPNLADYVRFIQGATYECLLATAATPPAGAGVRVDYLLGLGDGAAAATWTVGLYEGATQIAEWADEVTADPTVVSHTLTSGEAALVTDWSDLRLRFALTAVTG